MMILEIILAIAVLLIAVGATLASISSFVVLGDSTRENKRAYLEAQAAIERMRAANFAQVFALYNEDPNDDPAGVGTAPGAGFDVDLLTPQEGDPDAMAGRIEMPALAAVPGELREDLNDPDFGLPRDLSGDGIWDALDHSGNYILLPVRVLVEWKGRSGNRVVELQTMLIN